jgi:hypothetical protein
MNRLFPIGEFSLGALGLLAPTQVLVASQFLSIEQAQHVAFPHADRFDQIKLALTAEQQRQIDLLAGPQPAHGTLRAWQAYMGEVFLGHFIVDEVIGRQELITYAVAIDAAGKLGVPEILEYRESHGVEIRNGAWRKQFSGHGDLAHLRFGVDIKNIAGATLSCEHVTQGMRRVLALWQSVLNGPR